MSRSDLLPRLPLALAMALAGPAALAESGTSLTVYSSMQPGAVPPETYQQGDVHQSIAGYAVIRQEREVALKQGTNAVRYSDVAAKIDPTTVSFASLTDPLHTRVVEQNYQFDLVSTDKLLHKYLDREIDVEQQRANAVETYTGVLTSTAGGLVLRAADGSVRILNGYASVKLPSLPGGLITKPTLVWEIAAQQAGAHRTLVSYQTGGMTWWADYNLIYTEGGDAHSCQLDVGAWVSIVNQSGASYNDATLKLIAGDVQRVQRGRAMPAAAAELRSMAKMADAAGFEEKAFFEYHLYTLGFPTTLPDNSTKQLELFPTARAVACRKALIYAGQPAYRSYYGAPLTDRAFGVQSNKKVDVYLSYKNSKDNRLGIPLPAGRVRVSKQDPADRSLEFIGEDAIDHTPRDETVRIKLGSAFDVVGERKQIDFKLDTARQVMEEEFEIKVRNQKDEPVTVIVSESLYRWANWSIVRKSQDYEKIDSRTVHFPLQIAKGGEATLRYTVKYSW